MLTHPLPIRLAMSTRTSGISGKRLMKLAFRPRPRPAIDRSPRNGSASPGTVQVRTTGPFSPKKPESHRCSGVPWSQVSRVIAFLVKKGLLPPERAKMLCGWKYSGFNIHRSQLVPPRNRENMEWLAQYIIRTQLSVDKMQPNRFGHSITYRSGMKPKIQRNFKVFSPTDFIARIT
jgi:hypothetical protein